MGEASAPAVSGDVIPSDYTVAPLSVALVRQYEVMIESVPDAGGDGFEGILRALAMATDVLDLDAPWRSQGLGELINTPLVLTGIRKMPSDYPGGLPWFLVADGAIAATGETVTFTTGSVSVVAQLVNAWRLEKFPLRVIPRQAERPSRSGYFPQHLEIVG